MLVQILARRFWPQMLARKNVACKCWPANIDPQILARKYWPANFGPQILARKNVARKCWPAKMWPRKFWPANVGPQMLARKFWPAARILVTLVNSPTFGGSLLLKQDLNSQPNDYKSNALKHSAGFSSLLHLKEVSYLNKTWTHNLMTKSPMPWNTVQGCQLSFIWRESPTYTLFLPLSCQTYKISHILNVCKIQKCA